MRGLLLALTIAAALSQSAAGGTVTTNDSRHPRAVSRPCGTFLECLLGSRHAKPPWPGASNISDGATGEIVGWPATSKYAPGSVVIRTPERALYFVLGDGKAKRYKVGVGREGFQWSGNSRIVAKEEWPDWRPPPEMIEREAAKGHILPEEMAGGPNNPLGARAMYIGGTLYRIHGNNNPSSIGGAVSSGCIRMTNSDVVELYDLVKIGARIYVYQ
jgi:lipoprotein-anchoring transpeptidase ErfK/SrfK